MTKVVIDVSDFANAGDAVFFNKKTLLDFLDWAEGYNFRSDVTIFPWCNQQIFSVSIVDGFDDIAENVMECGGFVVEVD